MTLPVLLEPLTPKEELYLWLAERSDWTPEQIAAEALESVDLVEYVIQTARSRRDRRAAVAPERVPTHLWPLDRLAEMSSSAGGVG